MNEGRQHSSWAGLFSRSEQIFRQWVSGFAMQGLDGQVQPKRGAPRAPGPKDPCVPMALGPMGHPWDPMGTSSRDPMGPTGAPYLKNTLLQAILPPSLGANCYIKSRWTDGRTMLLYACFSISAIASVPRRAYLNLNS